MPSLPETLILVASAVALFYGVFLLRGPSTRVRSIAKALPVVILAMAAFLAGLPLIIVLALMACAAGDWFLSLEGEENFLSGLKAFLGGHLFYIAHFASQVPASRYLTLDMALLGLILIALAASVVARIWPYLGEMKGPVAVYALVIGTMAFTAKAAMPGQIVLAGIALFLVSDIILAQDKFTPLTNTLLRRAMPWLIWIFYFTGQALIVFGLAQGI